MTAALQAQAETPKATALTVTVEGVADGALIPATHAVCLPTVDGKSNTKGTNVRPAIRWSAVPKGTDSIAVFVMDPDVPADFTDAGKEGKTIAADARRQDFFHWALVNVAPTVTAIPPAEPGTTVVEGTELPNDMGKNKYVPQPGAYGGPCPPWNDLRMHHYHFIVLALGKDAPVRGKSTTATDDAKTTYQRLITSPHLLARGETTGLYSLNPALTAK